jgi:hypothetical protein
MPIYEYFCPEHNKIYQFYAKTLAQGQAVPKCPDDSKHRMVKMLSAFSVPSSSRQSRDATGSPPAAPGGLSSEDAQMEKAMSAMESEFSNVDENDPRAMGRMMRRMAELTGEKIDGEAEEMVRKLEEGADPESLEEQGGVDQPPPGGEDPFAVPSPPSEPRERSRARRRPPVRDPKLYDYDS